MSKTSTPAPRTSENPAGAARTEAEEYEIAMQEIEDAENAMVAHYRAIDGKEAAEDATYRNC